MSDFTGSELQGSRFERVDFTGARFQTSDFSNAEFRAVDFSGVVMRSVDLINVDITGSIENLVINGVDVGPYVEAELDRRDPLRVKMRPETPAGFREAWDIVEELWRDTVDRAQRLAPELLNESVDGEWSFIETLRHLVFATDAGVGRCIVGDTSPWHPLGLPWDEAPDSMNLPRDRDARPSLHEVLELRRERMATVRRIVDTLDDDSLEGQTTPVEGFGWPPPRSFPVRQCLLIVLNEEWEHRRYAERDLKVLTIEG